MGEMVPPELDVLLLPQCHPCRDGEQHLEKWLHGCGFSAWPDKARRCEGWLGGHNSFSFSVLLYGGQSPFRVTELMGPVRFWPGQ